jgi:nicotinate-nucleotide adenylyltransferase
MAGGKPQQRTDRFAASLTPVAIALFGTSADPPTEGHRVLLQGLAGLYPRVATWASDNPMKQHGAALEVRSALLGALVASIDNPRLAHEQELSSPWAIETLRRAERRWPNQELVFVVGSDLVPQIPRWRETAALLGRCRLAIAPRGGWPRHPHDLATHGSLGAPTEIRDLEVPAALRPVLLEHNRYGLAGPPPPPATP